MAKIRGMGSGKKTTAGRQKEKIHMDKAEERERERTREKAALMAFGALLAQYKGSRQPEEIAKEAWEAGNMFLRTGFVNAAHNSLRRYEFALHEYEGLEALRHIAELDGFKANTIDWLMKRYADEPDPLRAYAEDDEVTPKTFGQSMIGLLLAINAYG
jgi:hypothetical protein